MFTVDLDSAITFLVDSNLDRAWAQNHKEVLTGLGPQRDKTGYLQPGLYIEFPIDLSVWTGELDDDPDGEWARSHTLIGMVFTGNTSVWWSEINRMRGNPKWSEFVNSSNHDSCWRSDGFNFLFELYIKKRQELFDEFDLSASKYKDVESRSTWILNTKIVKCLVAYQNADSNDYRRKLISVDFDGT